MSSSSDWEAAAVAPFTALPRWSGEALTGFCMDWVGGATAGHFAGWSTNSGHVTPPYPPINEEWWEWVDLVSAVREAGERFTMIELGAGWGRWLIAAVGIGRATRPDLPMRLIGVEAEPTHFQWMIDHFRNNGVDPDAHRLIEAAVSDGADEVWFTTGHPAAWWGHAMTSETADFSDARFPELSRIRVPAVTLNELLASEQRVDLIDLDVQGAEARVLGAAIDALTAKVRRLHIGTHSPAIEGELRSLFGAAGWTCVNDFACHVSNDTPLGPVRFNDGVQSWVNPRL